MNNHEFYIWLAGFWEGGGCLNVTFSHRKGENVYCLKSGKRYGPYTVKKDVKKIQVVISNTNREILEKIVEKTGLGKIYQQKKFRKIRLKKPIYFWRIQRAEEVLLFLEKIKPYLQFRRVEVEEKLKSFMEH
ncbi:MAG: hypothetical protein DRO36_02420 [Candidatus Hecatellales archaeon]|nr:MAG: hypothetical protein DRO36_02420 [Candidatus Hecatellales archaeon]